MTDNDNADNKATTPPMPKAQQGQQAQQAKGGRKTPLVMIIAIAVLTPLASTMMFYFWQPAAATHKGEVITAGEVPSIFPPSSWRIADDEKGDDAESGGGLTGDGGEDWREQWRGKWTLLQTTSSAHCDDECRRRLCRMRQLRLMLPGHYLRLNRAWLINKSGESGEDKAAADDGGDDDKSAADGALTATSDCGEIQTETAAAQRAAEVDIVDGIFIIRGDNKALPAGAGEWRRDDYMYLIDPAGRLAMRFSPSLDIYAIRSDLSRVLKLSRGWRQTE